MVLEKGGEQFKHSWKKNITGMNLKEFEQIPAFECIAVPLFFILTNFTSLIKYSLVCVFDEKIASVDKICKHTLLV